MLRWLPRSWRIPLALKIACLPLLVLVPYVWLTQSSVATIRDLTRQQQETRLQHNAIGYAQLLGEEARRIQTAAEGIVKARSVEAYWSAYSLAIDEETAGRRQHDLQAAIVESQAIAGLDFLALAESRSDLYLTHGSAAYGTPIPSGSLLRHLATEPPEMVLPVRPAFQWRWALEHHPPTSPEGSGPFLVVGGPVYFPDLEGNWRLAGYLAAGKRLDAGMLGNPGETAEGEPVQVYLGRADATLLWSTLDPTAEPDRFLLSLAESGQYQAALRPFRRRGDPAPLLVAVYDLAALPDQATAWHQAPRLVAVQPESRSSLLLTVFRREWSRTSLIGLVGYVLLAIFFAMGLSRPLQKLTAAVNRFAKGESLDLPPVPATRDEIETLSSTFVRMAAEREEATQRLIRAEKLAAWQDVARKLAHEIKNPLSPVQLQIENLVRTANRNPERLPVIIPEAAEIVLYEVGRLKKLADEFSEFARMPGALLVPTGLGPLVHHALELVRLQYPAVEFEAALPAEVPLLALDQDKITQALLNLLQNAAEAGAQAVTLTVQRGHDGAVLLRVADDGPGLTPEDRERIFTPYFTTKETGTGLGLVMVQQIMDEHGGKVTCESAPGDGAAFTLRFPPQLLAGSPA